jgi:hypothetical protein
VDGVGDVLAGDFASGTGTNRVGSDGAGVLAVGTLMGFATA